MSQHKQQTHYSRYNFLKNYAASESESLFSQELLARRKKHVRLDRFRQYLNDQQGHGFAYNTSDSQQILKKRKLKHQSPKLETDEILARVTLALLLLFLASAVYPSC